MTTWIQDDGAGSGANAPMNATTGAAAERSADAATGAADGTLGAIFGAKAVTLAGEPVHLLPERALWWPAARTLFVADVHLGKAASFRALGQPVPSGTTRDNLDRLSTLIDRWQAERLVVLGDWLHAAAAQQAQVIEPVMAWRSRHAALHCLLVRGNHDSHAGDPPPALRFEMVDEPHRMGPFAACHMPGASGEPSPAIEDTAGPARADAVGFRLAGHLHPAVRLHGAGGDRLRLPCFCETAQQLILPAFGAFTGTTVSGLPAGARCYPVGGGQVHGPIPAPAQGVRFRRR